MRNSIAAALALSVLAAAPTLAAQNKVKTPPASYLDYKVYSVDQLVDEIAASPTLRARYARHFGVPEDRLLGYLRANLVESYVPETKRYAVYCVSPSGKFYTVRQRFRQGTKVFALRNGQPVLKWVCGNPLSRTLPPVVRRTATRAVTRVSPMIETLLPAETEDVFIPSETLAAEPYTPLLPADIGNGIAATAASAGGGAGFPLAGLLPAAFLISHNGGNSSPAVAVVGGGGGTPLPTPEPGGPLALLLGSALLGAAVLRRGTFRRRPASESERG